MPELPEVETVRRGLAPVFENAQIVNVVVNRPDLRFPFPDDFAQRLKGQYVNALSRRAKYLLADLSNSEALVMHLGMSGSFRINGAAQHVATAVHCPDKLPQHDHVIFELQQTDGTVAEVIYNDPRRFGFMDLVSRRRIYESKFFKGLGIEPLGNELNADYLQTLFAGKKTNLKAALLNQKNIAGLGNIYVCEALWRTGLNPMDPVNVICGEDPQAQNLRQDLCRHIREVLSEAIEAGGSSLKDHSQADGTLGYFQHRFAVYDREGQPCSKPGCDGEIMRQQQSGRSTFYCPICQKSRL
ncbi:bifunctional DNA-formamidopyrimidine glycosylase/DNA-(apurinic or apyrimidinic site) lyase [Polycladidibacter stylochi]|uniref:bifunctional DNA-formamidopyrimidine glycosylase/DNA-(apurinic or apyrimidinic site) lyase n=1 Tax=Polycladidibacter stylochi TaxID=1807766 RepID=UPI00082EC7FE|nr:bifunctional DNA-formamidopyrimidine glycosylase/DNA-(apurinic or apyrimidinic site) lyase [Pseudovibrio stylochi]